MMWKISQFGWLEEETTTWKQHENNKTVLPLVTIKRNKNSKQNHSPLLRKTLNNKKSEDFLEHSDLF